MPRIWTRFFLGIGFATTTGIAGDASAAECLTRSGKTACGFHCVASDGQVKCAQTPQGVCSVSSGVVVCWDPPPVLRRVFVDRVPPPSCVSTSYQTACGYSCETSNDRVACAQTPFGRCRAREGKIVCSDPPAPVMLTRRQLTPATECISSSGKIRCGYHCQSRDGVLACAQTPDGACSVEQGNLVCWDPPLSTYAVTYESSADLACIDGAEGPTCGYNCLANLTHSACASKRGDSCRTMPERIVCAAAD
jgi:hypothetical protein